MRKIDDTELKKILLDMLIFFKQICDENNISYSLAYGTVLGAIRHGGFIPWDDDVDVYIKRPQMNKMISIFENINHPFYKIVCKQNSNLYFGGYAMLIDTRTYIYNNNIIDEKLEGLGVYIDIFPLDGVVKDKKLSKIQNKIKFYKTMGSLSILKTIPPATTKFKTILKIILSYYAKFKGLEYYTNKIEKIALAVDFESAFYVADVIWDFKYLYPKKLFEENSEIEFENELFKVPKDFDKYLTITYGNYQVPPPINERVNQHPYEYFYK